MEGRQGGGGGEERAGTGRGQGRERRGEGYARSQHGRGGGAARAPSRCRVRAEYARTRAPRALACARPRAGESGAWGSICGATKRINQSFLFKILNQSFGKSFISFPRSANPALVARPIAPPHRHPHPPLSNPRPRPPSRLGVQAPGSHPSRPGYHPSAPAYTRTRTYATRTRARGECTISPTPARTRAHARARRM